MIGDSSRDNCLRTITGISSGPVALFTSRFEMSLATSFTFTLKFGIQELVLGSKPGKGWFESPRVEFAAKFEANNLALSMEEESTSGPLMIFGIGDLPWFRPLLPIIQNSLDPRRWSAILACTDSA